MIEIAKEIIIIPTINPESARWNNPFLRGLVNNLSAVLQYPFNANILSGQSKIKIMNIIRFDGRKINTDQRNSIRIVARNRIIAVKLLNFTLGRNHE
jgi:hypothetical protein